MLLSYQWLRELLEGTALEDGRRLVEALSPEGVAERLTRAGLEIEGVAHVGSHLRAVRVARVLSSRAHPSGKNTLVTIDAGEGFADGPLELVCGAPNVPAPGGLVCYAPVGARVFDRKGAAFVLEEKSIQGVRSRGMLCAEDELGLGTDHDGIVVLAEGTPGAPLLELFPSFEDWIFTVNVTPNRPDALGHLGLAREVAALYGARFERLAVIPPRGREEREGEALALRVEDPTGCPEYRAARVFDVAVGPSPWWLRVRLSRLGVRPISNVVDVTNYVLLERGQPLHAFDFDKLAEKTLVVRRAQQDERLETLDGVQRALDASDLVIADAQRAVALAGVMGSEASGVTASTARVVLESAFFHPSSVRRSAQRHRIHSEASHRFEREVDREGVADALDRATGLLDALAGGVAVGAPVAFVAAPLEPVALTLRFARVRALTGADFGDDECVAALERLGFAVTARDEASVTVTVPGPRRADVQREVDLVEEVARVLGYERIPAAIPPSAGARAGARRDFALRRRLRVAAAAAGLDEAVNYAFVGAADLSRTGLPTERAGLVAVRNPLSEERGLLRPSLVPGLLRAASSAARYGEQRVRLFEVGTVFAPREAEHAADPARRDDPVREETRVAALLVGPRDAYLARPSPVDFFDGKGVAEALVESTLLEPASFDGGDAALEAPPPWAHPRACARVLRSRDGAPLGWVGELHPDACEAWELPRGSVALELRAAGLDAAPRVSVAQAPGRFPTVRRDVTLELERARAVGAVAQALAQGAGALCVRCEPVDRYEGKGVPEGSHAITFTLWLRSTERTLTDDEVERAMSAALAAATEQHGARQR